MGQPNPYDVIIVGAGIVGASVAWHLARRGMRIAVLDASGPAAGASGAADGAVSVASKKPGAMMALASASLDYCKALAGEGGVLDGVFSLRPTYVFASSPAESEALDQLRARLEAPHVPVSVTHDSPGRTATVAGLGDGVTRILELSGEGHMLGYAATNAFLSQTRADRLWPCKVEEIEADPDGVRVQTDTGELRAARLVVANGLGSMALLPNLPVFPRSGQLIVTDRATGPDWPGLPGPLTSAAYLRDKSDRTANPGRAPVVIDPLRTGQLLIGSSREDHGTDRHTDFATVRRILESGVACLPALAGRRVIRVFAGVRTATADGLPIVGPLPGLPNVILATGFEGDGICLSPLIGREVAHLMTGGEVHPDLAGLAPGRFDEERAVAR